MNGDGALPAGQRVFYNHPQEQLETKGIKSSQDYCKTPL